MYGEKRLNLKFLYAVLKCTIYQNIAITEFIFLIFFCNLVCFIKRSVLYFCWWNLFLLFYFRNILKNFIMKEFKILIVQININIYQFILEMFAWDSCQWVFINVLSFLLGIVLKCSQPDQVIQKSSLMFGHLNRF